MFRSILVLAVSAFFWGTSSTAQAATRDGLLTQGGAVACNCLKQKGLTRLSSTAKQAAMKECTMKGFVAIIGDLTAIGVDITKPNVGEAIGQEMALKALQACPAEVMALADTGNTNEREAVQKKLSSKLCSCMKSNRGSMAKSQLSEHCMKQAMIQEIKGIMALNLDMGNGSQMEKFGQEVGLMAIQECPNQVLDL